MDKEKMSELLSRRGMSIRGLATELKTSTSNVRYWLRKFGLVSRGINGRAWHLKKKEPGKCVVCEGGLKSGKKFCSMKCSQRYRYQAYIKRWLGGKEIGACKNSNRASGCEVSGHVQRWLRETRGNKCEECGWSRVHPIAGIVPLQPHHIDGDGANNRPENLKLLCAACHTLTENWGRWNKRRALA